MFIPKQQAIKTTEIDVSIDPIDKPIMIVRFFSFLDFRI